MYWSWWGGLLLVGVAIGGLAAWSKGGWRVLMKTLAVPVTLALARHFFSSNATPGTAPYVGLDFLLLAVSALLGDYLVGLALGRHGADGYRHDSVGH